jgi:hypothetical protein
MGDPMALTLGNGQFFWLGDAHGTSAGERGPRTSTSGSPPISRAAKCRLLGDDGLGQNIPSLPFSALSYSGEERPEEHGERATAADPPLSNAALALDVRPLPGAWRRRLRDEWFFIVALVEGFEDLGVSEEVAQAEIAPMAGRAPGLDAQ